MRVIADSPAYALAAKALLEQAQTRSSTWPFTKSVVVYAAGGAKAFAGVMFSGGKAGEVTGKGGDRRGREGGREGVLMQMSERNSAISPAFAQQFMC